MAEILIPFGHLEAPTDQTVRWLQPTGTELASMAEVANHLVAHRFLRHVQTCWTGPITGLGPLYVAPPAAESKSAAWFSNPFAAQVWVVIDYQSAPPESAGDVYIEMTLHDLNTAADIDAPGGGAAIRLDAADETLEVRAELVFLGLYAYPVTRTTTGSLAYGGEVFPTHRRALNIPEASRGHELELRFECENVRIVRVGVIEAPPVSVET